MKLTSYNMAVKTLHAMGCFADMVDRMWAYIQEGDMEKAECARERSLVLLGLIKTAEKWTPTISSGYTTTIRFDYSDVTTSTPYYLSFQRVLGMIVNTPFISFEGTENFVDCLLFTSYRYISDVDDIVQLQYSKVNDLVFDVKFYSTKDVNSFTNDGDIGTQTGAVTITVLEESTQFTDNQPPCLTNEQILSVVKKIDELCDNCNC